MGLYASLLILSTQRSEAVLADARAKLILEVAIAAEQKSAKIIQLLEEARRDNPLLADRNDDQAHDMSSPTDPQAILAAIGNDSEKIRGKEPCPTAPSAP